MSRKPRKKVYERLRADSGQHRRIMAVALIFGMLAFVPVGFRLYSLMVTDYDYYADLALRNQTRTTRVTADRGILYDRNMNILACNRSVETVYLDPHELKQSKADLADLSRALADILELDAAWVYDQARDTTKRYKQIAAGVEENVSAQIRGYINEKKISGIHLEPNSKRSYPYGTLASQLIGFTNSSNDGCEGIEAAYDSYLAGGYGTVITTKGNNEMDMPYSYEHYAANKDACDVILTIDVTVQTCLEKQMQAAIERYDVQNGAFGMAMDVNTGEILAMATLGGYDPNRYSEIHLHALLHQSPVQFRRRSFHSHRRSASHLCPDQPTDRRYPV